MEFVQHLPNFAQLVAVSSVAGSSELQCPTLPLYTLATLQQHTLQCLYVVKLVALTNFM
jgi:hypothetical protein